MINIYGAVILVLLMIPNIVYFQKLKKNGEENVQRKGSSVDIIEQIGRYGCIIFMLVNTGFFERGFASGTAICVWGAVSAVLIAGYYIYWVLLFKKPSVLFYKIMLAVLPCILFIFSSIIMRRPAALFFSTVFAISHIYITCKN